MIVRRALFAFIVLAAACAGRDRLVRVEAGGLEIGIDSRGWITSFRGRDDGREFVPPGHEAPLLTLRAAGADLTPVGARWVEPEGVLTLAYEGGLEAEVRIRAAGTHATFELLSVAGPDSVPSMERGSAPVVELAIWGPYPTTIRATIGETVGVVRDGTSAIGLQALNPKTLGGYPWNGNDAMPQLDIFESGDFSDLSEAGKRAVLYRVEAAKPDSFGSTLQAYTRDRSRTRVIANWGRERYAAPPFDDGGIVGSQIALFGCAADSALATIGAIEVAEGLPHPTIDGVWGKEARSAAAAYLILPFSESTIDRAVEVTLRAGLRYLYHPGPFETWGHFELNGDFPHGVDGLRASVEKAEARGVHVGVHTLSNFITTNDAYVTPVPDPHLARVGTTVLTRPVGADATDLAIESPDFFGPSDSDNLHAAVMGDEIIRYGAVSDAPPWTLLDVERGAFGTRKAAHEAVDSIGKLADHGYRVFLGDATLSMEMASRLADLFNSTGLRQISFDGLEGNRSTGMGNYGEILFTTTWYDHLSESIRSHYIADASRTSHYFWHIYTRMNWGEPWYAGFRESQTEYRLKNQAYFRRNLMPGMLGWFQMRPGTSVADVEWMLARSAAFDAGYAFVTSFDALERNGAADEILTLIGLWEEARMAGAFTPEQKRRMEDVGREFHLERADDGWTLTGIHSGMFRYEGRGGQPGGPSVQTFTFENPAAEQPLGFVLTAAGTATGDVRLELDGSGVPVTTARLREGESLVYEGGDEATIYTSEWRVAGSVPVDAASFRVAPGTHRLTLDAMMRGGDDAHVTLELRVRGAPESVPRQR